MAARYPSIHFFAEKWPFLRYLCDVFQSQATQSCTRAWHFGRAGWRLVLKSHDEKSCSCRALISWQNGLYGQTTLPEHGIFFWKSMPTNYSRLGKSDWSLLKPLLQTTKLCTRPAKRDDTRCPGRKTRSRTMGPVRPTLFLDVGNEQAPSRRNNQLAEAPILHVGCITNN